MSNLGNKLTVYKQLREEVNSDFWQEVRSRDEKMFADYFENQYSIFKQQCPELYKSAINNEHKNDERHEKMLSLAQDLYNGKITKEKGDAIFSKFCAKRIEK